MFLRPEEIDELKKMHAAVKAKVHIDLRGRGLQPSNSPVMTLTVRANGTSFWRPLGEVENNELVLKSGSYPFTWTRRRTAPARGCATP